VSVTAENQTALQDLPCSSDEGTANIINGAANHNGNTTMYMPKAASGSDTGLPENLCVLYADDSHSLQKMFTRSIQRATRGWTIHPVECGEDAVTAAEMNQFDLIFLDQHMRTDMLGTDTARVLREKGVTSIICGLSGDDIESHFINAGASCFMMKPFPCEKYELAAELDRILKSSKQ
jgi:PleD family two-component response regulator